jgi:putative polyhydroxyalkanoate system protein
MAHISIQRKHKKTIAQAREVVEHIAKGMARKFSIEYEWDSNTLHFSRSGVDGHIALSRGLVSIEARLGFLLMALKGPIESEIERYLDKELSD